MSEATRTRTHAPEVRQRAVEILQEGVGHRALAAKLGIPQATARQWARTYAVGGADAVLNAGARHHTYSYDVKLAVVKDRLENGLTVREAMIKHKIPASLRSRLGVVSIARAVSPRWSISRVVASRALSRQSSKRVRPRGRIFLAAPTFWTATSLSEHPPKWLINRTQWPVRPSLR